MAMEEGSSHPEENHGDVSKGVQENDLYYSLIVTTWGDRILSAPRTTIATRKTEKK